MRQIKSLDDTSIKLSTIMRNLTSSYSCGNLSAIMENLIESVSVDAKYSFEDSILPVTEAKKKSYFRWF